MKLSITLLPLLISLFSVVLMNAQIIEDNNYYPKCWGSYFDDAPLGNPCDSIDIELLAAMSPSEFYNYLVNLDYTTDIYNTCFSREDS